MRARKCRDVVIIVAVEIVPKIIAVASVLFDEVYPSSD